MRVWNHMRALWPRATMLPAAPFVLWSLVTLSWKWRWEFMALLIVAPLLAYTNRATKRLFIGIFPMGVVGLLYDSMRLFKTAGLTPADIHTCDMQRADARFFGITVKGQLESLCDWFPAHHLLLVDIVSAAPYGTFLYIVVGYAVYLYFRDFVGLKQLAWSFLFLNMAGFATYHLYPAAPPWYVHAHGCVASLSAEASAGPALLRVDSLLGMNYFASMYGRSNDVFGAMPSLHAGYPTLILLNGWHRHGALGRSLSLLFLGTMCFAAVYLDHHWVLDVVVGICYATGANALARSIFRGKLLSSLREA